MENTNETCDLCRQISGGFVNMKCSYCGKVIKREFKELRDFFNLLDKCDGNPHDFDDLADYVDDFPMEWKIECVKKNNFFIQYITDKTDELCRLAIAGDGDVIDSIPEHVKTPDFWRFAVACDGLFIQWVPEELRTPELLSLASEKLGKDGHNYLVELLQI